MNRQKGLVLSLVLACATLGAVASRTIWLPTDWSLTPPHGAASITGTMPQGLALSPDGSEIAVIESGVNPPALRILDTRDLHPLRVVPLKDAFGTPVWTDNAHVLVPGATTNAVLLVEVRTGAVSVQPAASYISAVARTSDGTVYATSDLDNQLVRVGSTLAPLSTGAHPAAIALTGTGIYVANRGESTISEFPGAHGIAVDLHPAALALSPDRLKLYVACSDADSIDVIDTKTGAVVARIDVGVAQGPGASPNALAVASDGTLYASLGAQNAIAEIRARRVVSDRSRGRRSQRLCIKWKRRRLARQPRFSPGAPSRSTVRRFGDDRLGAIDRT